MKMFVEETKKCVSCNIADLERVKDLAKKNDQLFLVEFLQLFPNFYTSLGRLGFKLQNSELTLLAYIYLNFEAKEIANYTFKSLKTIQNRKHLLRKKLKISPTEDFYIWLNGVVSDMVA